MTKPFVSLLLAVSIIAGCGTRGTRGSAGADDDGEAFEDYRADAQAAPRCFATPPAIPESWQTVVLPGGVGTLRLPPGYRARSASGAQEWLAADSSVLTVSVDAQPTGGLASGPGTLLDRIGRPVSSRGDGPCALTVGGIPMVAYRWVNFSAADPDSVHGLMGHVLLRRGRVVNLVLLATSRAPGDSILLALSGIELARPAR